MKGFLSTSAEGEEEEDEEDSFIVTYTQIGIAKLVLCI